MSRFTRDHTHRLVRNLTPPLEPMEDENPNANVPLVCTMQDIYNPTRITQRSCIVAPGGNAQNIFTVKPQHIQMLPHFHGMSS